MFQVLVFLPLIGFIIAALFGKIIGHRQAEIITTSFMVISAILAWVGFITIALKGGHPVDIHLLTWLSIGSFSVDWAIKVDSLSSVMLIVVCTVSCLVHLYSIGYMHEDKSRARFFSYLSLFTFMMLMLVTADNIVQMFFGWEGVGLASYLLIGFWFEKESANKAAIKAFVTNRVGDFAFLLGIFSIYIIFEHLQFTDIFTKVNDANFLAQKTNFLNLMSNSMAVEAICLFLFIGAMGKSAQFLLHVWLPDAMEGPTPVSALIHAATMVTSGVFMIARMSPLFEHAHYVSILIVIVGSITAFFAATVGLVQNDIKRVIAYSTCSQLGYMFVALGVGAYGVAVFHLFTHAFFKALLFLGAGSVIHAVSGEQDMRKMGALRSYIPVTYYMMIIGTLALTGFGIPGTFIGTAGYFSKDAIIEASFVSDNVAGQFAFVMLVVAALFTSFYSWRVIFMTFNGKFKGPVDVLHHVHESGPVMLIPLLVLSLGALFAGCYFKPYFIGDMYTNFWNGSLFLRSDNHILHEMHHISFLIKISPFVAMCLGFLLALLFYIINPTFPEKLANKFSVLYKFLLNKWYIDEIYNYLFVKPVFCIGNFFWKFCDINIIDRFGPNGAAMRVLQVTGKVKRIQTGFIYHYAFSVIVGALFLLSWMILGSYL